MTEKLFTLTLVENELNYLAQILAERPFKEVAGLLGKLNQQIAQQVRATPLAPPLATPEAPKTEG